MSDVNKEALDSITKEHKDRIKEFHVKVMSDISESIKTLTEYSQVQSRLAIAGLMNVLDYFKSYRKLAYGELDKLAETFLQEDPGMEVTAGAYDQIKDLITSNNSTDLPDDITRYICDKLISCGYKKINNIKSTINAVVRDRLAANLTVLFEEMDENTVILETESNEELKKENASLKAELEAYKKAIDDVKKKFS